MRIVIAAVGKLKDSEEHAIVARYVERVNGAGRALGVGPTVISEFPDSRAAGAMERKRDEAARLLKVASDADFVVVLDTAGKSMSSEAFARFIAERRDAGAKKLAFLIGGPDGHGEGALKTANLKMSLGALTLPHGLARVILAEQLYRAATILSGHPYHRA
jgi:23S rRNA (pseudouridine1915-N3)-methyltransferase